MPIVPQGPPGVSDYQANAPAPEALLMAAAEMHSQNRLVGSDAKAKRPGKIKVPK